MITLVIIVVQLGCCIGAVRSIVVVDVDTAQGIVVLHACPGHVIV